MARYRISGRAAADIAYILRTSAERWGLEGRRRYAALLAEAMRKAAAAPQGPTTRLRGELIEGLRSMHLRHARGTFRDVRVRRPVHVLYYREIGSDVIEILRVLHEAMEPSRHLHERDQ